MEKRDDLAIFFRQFLRIFPPFSPFLVMLFCMIWHPYDSAMSFRSALSSGTLFIGCMLLCASIMRRKVQNGNYEFLGAFAAFFFVLIGQYLMLRWSIFQPPKNEQFFSFSTWPIWFSFWLYLLLLLWSYRIGALDGERISFDEHD